ncbi:hypothetical protein MYXO_03699 [Myxococcaceae bacterium]|nr:hypothetical protein MYXO_03699 [Myxococcaceae bacterium]
MRKCFGLLAVVAMLVAGRADAAPTPWAGSLTIRISSLPWFRVGVSGTSNYSGGATFTLPARKFWMGATLPVTDPAAFPIAGVRALVSNGAGSFAGGSGVMAITGSGNVCLFSPCASAVANVDVPFTMGPGTRGVGIGGGPILASGYVDVTVQGAPWTVGIATVMTVMGGTAMATGYVAGNNVQLVTPVVINTNIGASATLSAFGILNLTFVPEPSTLLLLASGVATLALLGRTRASG